MIDENTQRKALRWLADGETGASSETMAYWLAFGMKKERDFDHPRDLGDFNRCLSLLAAAPGLRPELPRMGELSSAWSALVSRWTEIEICFLDEAGLDWPKASCAPKAYELMRSILKAPRKAE